MNLNRKYKSYENNKFIESPWWLTLVGEPLIGGIGVAIRRFDDELKNATMLEF
jgi:hypothetical protein